MTSRRRIELRAQAEAEIVELGTLSSLKAQAAQLKSYATANDSAHRANAAASMSIVAEHRALMGRH